MCNIGIQCHNLERVPTISRNIFPGSVFKRHCYNTENTSLQEYVTNLPAFFFSFNLFHYLADGADKMKCENTCLDSSNLPLGQ